VKQRIKAVLANVRDMLADIEIVQTIADVETAAEAKNRIHYFAAIDDGAAINLPPRIILDIDGLSEEFTASQFGGTVRVLILLEATIPTANAATEQDQALWFWDVVENILDDSEDAINADGGLVVRNRDISIPPGPIDPADLPESFATSPVWLTQMVYEVAT